MQGSKAAASSVEDESGVADTLRAAPLAAGAVGILATLGNRIFSGVCRPAELQRGKITLANHDY
jgi:hypothetical protein